MYKMINLYCVYFMWYFIDIRVQCPSISNLKSNEFIPIQNKFIPTWNVISFL